MNTVKNENKILPVQCDHNLSHVLIMWLQLQVLKRAFRPAWYADCHTPSPTSSTIWPRTLGPCAGHAHYAWLATLFISCCGKDIYVIISDSYGIEMKSKVCGAVVQREPKGQTQLSPLHQPLETKGPNLRKGAKYCLYLTPV